MPVLKRTPTFIQGLQSASFADCTFPVSETSVQGAQRTAMHEFPHTAGGALERLGRRAYSFRVTPIFDENVVKRKKDSGGDKLYPDSLNYLQRTFEFGTSGPLIIPTLGTIQAVMTGFERKFSSNVLSGESAQFEFTEDQSLFFLSPAVAPRASSAAAFSSTTNNCLIQMTAAHIEPNLFDKLQSAVNAVLGIFDQAELYANYAASKVGALAQIISQVNRRAKTLQNPDGWQALEALKELWLSTFELKRTITFENFFPTYFFPNTNMTIQEVSQAVYGTTSRTMELLQMNSIEDPMVITPGTSIRYFAGSVTPAPSVL